MSIYALFSNAFSQTSAPSIDAEAGTIAGVAVITEGPALGHTDYGTGLPIYADATTLAEVLACASQFEGGLKVKMTHGGDAADIVGVLRNFRIDDAVLRADFQSLKTTPHRDYIFEIAETLPHAFGLSIAFTGEREIVGEQAMARCAEIYSADLVSEPAANPNGLFTALPRDAQKPKTNHLSKMDPKEINDLLAKLSEQVDEIGSRLSKLESTDEPKMLAEEDEEIAEIAEIAETVDSESNDEDEELATDDKDNIAELAAKAALKLFTQKFGAPAVTPSREPNNPASKKVAVTFESLVGDQVNAGKTKVEAIRFCAKNHTSEHAAYEHRVRSGELITL